MPYPEPLIIPMREDLTKFGVKEARTAADVDTVINASGTVLMITNSVCGCAAGKARPAVGMALQNAVKPDTAATVFAGADVEAVARLRAQHLQGVPPSSPSMALFRDGKVVWALHRFEIESRQAPEIAALLTDAFNRFCAKTSA
ncbi:MAG: BrxA/BrxB family bacilliredoxin [Bryobacterales bacterium]|nr:BrxA/BrxB family bacilliredoxin [Bryobacterales bacterium]